MVVGREDGVYFFSPEDRGGAAGFEGKKQHVGCLWNYILVSQRAKIETGDREIGRERQRQRQRCIPRRGYKIEVRHNRGTS